MDCESIKFKPISENSQKDKTFLDMTAKKCHDDKPNLVLNLYDAARSAHTSNAEISKTGSLVVDRFRDEITCYVCKKILHTPFLITTCMHRVCKSCLPPKEAFKKCPVCEKDVHRILHDINFEMLIGKLLKYKKNLARPNVFEMFEAHGVDFDSYTRKESINRLNNIVEESVIKLEVESNHVCEPSTSNEYDRNAIGEPRVKRSRSGSASSRLMIAESPEPDDDLRPPALNSEVMGNHICNTSISCMVKPPSIDIQPPPILVSSPSKGPPTFIVLPKDTAVYAMNAHQSNGTFVPNDCKNEMQNIENGQFITPNMQPSNSLKRAYQTSNASTSTYVSRLTPIKPKFSQRDIIQIRTPSCWINLCAKQLNTLPLNIDPSSLVPISSNLLAPNFINVISMCNDDPPTYAAKLAAFQPTHVEMTFELRKLITQLPQEVLDLLPQCCREKQLIKPSYTDESALNVRKQKMSRSIYAPLILWPDGSVYKEDLPTCTKHPRYIYITLDTSIGHLIEYILKRTEIEANWTYRDKYSVEITSLDEEKDEVVLLLSSKTKECFNQPGLESAQFLSLKVDEGLFNTMIAISQPFTALSPMITVADLFNHYHPNKKRPLKVVYRFVRNDD